MEAEVVPKPEEGGLAGGACAGAVAPAGRAAKREGMGGGSRVSGVGGAAGDWLQNLEKQVELNWAKLGDLKGGRSFGATALHLP
jgi:hypothetical protein